MEFYVLRQVLSHLEVLLESDTSKEERIGDDLHNPFHVHALHLVYRRFDELPGLAVCLPSLTCFEVFDEICLALFLKQLTKPAIDEDVVLAQREILTEVLSDSFGNFRSLEVITRGRLFHFLLRIRLGSRYFRLNCSCFKHELISVCSFHPDILVGPLDMFRKII